MGNYAMMKHLRRINIKLFNVFLAKVAQSSLLTLICGRRKITSGRSVLLSWQIKHQNTFRKYFFIYRHFSNTSIAQLAGLLRIHSHLWYIFLGWSGVLKRGIWKMPYQFFILMLSSATHFIFLQRSFEGFI